MKYVKNAFVFLQQREMCAPKMHLQETVEELTKFNARRKLKVDTLLECLVCMFFAHFL